MLMIKTNIHTTIYINAHIVCDKAQQLCQ